MKACEEIQLAIHYVSTANYHSIVISNSYLKFIDRLMINKNLLINFDFFRIITKKNLAEYHVKNIMQLQ